ncbi:MAG: ABC transporter substrate-binding protein, partial [Betaproteobacteria bacterium]
MPSPSIIAELAPRGTLRAAINFGNPVLAGMNAAGQPCGISVDLAHELARRLGVPIELVHYQSAGHVPAALASNAWDICFLAIDPKRAADIAFTAPYAVIEGVYMVASDSSVRSNDAVDREGTRIGVIDASAYDLFLTRELKHATILREPSAEAVMNLWVAGMLDAVAGVKPQLEADARRIGGLRLLPERFMAINQAMGTPRGRDAAATYLREFVDHAKSSGL